MKITSCKYCGCKLGFIMYGNGFCSAVCKIDYTNERKRIQEY